MGERGGGERENIFIFGAVLPVERQGPTERDNKRKRVYSLSYKHTGECNRILERDRCAHTEKNKCVTSE